jgi:hypothetical protein
LRNEELAGGSELLLVLAGVPGEVENACATTGPCGVGATVAAAGAAEAATAFRPARSQLRCATNIVPLRFPLEEGHPLNATTALASANTQIAPAIIEPVVPSPAKTALEVRIRAHFTYRRFREAA